MSTITSRAAGAYATLPNPSVGNVLAFATVAVGMIVIGGEVYVRQQGQQRLRDLGEQANPFADHFEVTTADTAAKVFDLMKDNGWQCFYAITPPRHLSCKAELPKITACASALTKLVDPSFPQSLPRTTSADLSGLLSKDSNASLMSGTCATINELFKHGVTQMAGQVVSGVTFFVATQEAAERLAKLAAKKFPAKDRLTERVVVPVLASVGTQLAGSLLPSGIVAVGTLGYGVAASRFAVADLAPLADEGKSILSPRNICVLVGATVGGATTWTLTSCGMDLSNAAFVGAFTAGAVSDLAHKVLRFMPKEAFKFMQK